MEFMKKVIRNMLPCIVVGHSFELSSRLETYIGYSGRVVTGEVAYKSCKKCRRIWKEVWCGFSEFYWEEVNNY